MDQVPPPHAGHLWAVAVAERGQAHAVVIHEPDVGDRRRHPQKGVVVVISDFFDKGGFEEGLRFLLGRNYDVYCLQLLCPAEIDPSDLAGDLKLLDIEDADTAEVTISRPLINRYKANLHAYCGQLREYCTRRGIVYLFTDTTVPFDQMVLSYLRQRGLLR